MPCPACEYLKGKSARHTDPHPALEMTDSEKWSDLFKGPTSGVLEHYKCKECGAEWERDMDKKDNAHWSMSSNLAD